MLQSPWFWRRTLGWCCIVVVQMKPHAMSWWSVDCDDEWLFFFCLCRESPGGPLCSNSLQDGLGSQQLASIRFLRTQNSWAMGEGEYGRLEHMWSNVSNRKFWLFDGETHGVLTFHGRFSLDKAWKCFWCVQFFQSWLIVFKWSFMSTHKGKKLVSRSAWKTSTVKVHHCYNWRMH